MKEPKHQAFFVALGGLANVWCIESKFSSWAKLKETIGRPGVQSFTLLISLPVCVRLFKRKTGI